MDTNAAGVTVKIDVPESEAKVAVITAVPAPTLSDKPSLPAVLLIVATVPSFEVHAAEVVRSCVLPSVYVPVAVNCCVVPIAMDALGGVTAIETSTAGVTVNVVFPDTAPDSAAIVVVPLPTPEADPFRPAALLIVATPGLDELHRAVLVISCWVRSLKVAVAENCCVVPKGMLGIAGVTATDTTIAGVTVSPVEPLTPPTAAPMVVCPVPALLACPWLGDVLLTLATAVLDELHVADAVTSSVLPSLYKPVAVNC